MHSKNTMKFPIKLCPSNYQVRKISLYSSVEEEIYKKYLFAKNIILSSEPKLPTKPSLPSNFYSKHYNKSNLYMVALINLISITLLCLLIIGMFSAWIFLIQQIEIGFFIATTIIFIIISIYLYNGMKPFLLKLKEIFRNIEDIDREKNYFAIYPELNQKYLLAIEKYKNDLFEYESQTKNLQKSFKKYKNSKKYQKEFNLLFNSKFQTLVKEVFTNPGWFLKTTKIIQKGTSENYFKKYLIKYFGSEFIFTDLSFIKFVPDFLLKIQNLNFFLDIEIDEPYIGTSKEVIHYIDNNFYSDEERNEIFLKNQIPVIRFSEQQIVRYPDSCCKEIYSFISFLIPNPFENRFNNIPDLIPEQVWDYNLGSKMAQENYRDTYLLKNGFLIV